VAVKMSKGQARKQETGSLIKIRTSKYTPLGWNPMNNIIHKLEI
jgi:hypothetical protein